MPSEIQRRKFDHMFRVYDVDRDGQITQDDYQAFVHRLARLRGWADDHPVYQNFLARTGELWRGMREVGDADGDNRVSLQEYHTYISGWIVQGIARVDQSADLWFSAFDDDGDGRVTAEEYRVVLEAYGMDAVSADAYFRRFDLDGDSFLSRDEVRVLNRQFWFSEDRSEPGHYILGPVDGLPAAVAHVQTA